MPKSLTNGRYDIGALLGKGTFAKVFSAWDHKYKEIVALKIVRAIDKYYRSGLVEVSILKQIYKEMKKCRAMQPRPCLKLFSFFEVSGHLVIVTEILGSSIYEVLKQNDHLPFPFDQCTFIAAQLVRAVQFLHTRCGVVHTDLKLENIVFTSTAPFIKKTVTVFEPTKGRNVDRTIMVPEDLHVKLIDLGGATADTGKHRTRIINTRQYRGPEVILQTGWGTSSDIWSLGCILAELYTGDLLFGTHDNMEHLALMQRILKGRDGNSAGFPQTMLGKAENDRTFEFFDEDANEQSYLERGAACNASDCFGVPWGALEQRCQAWVEKACPLHQVLASVRDVAKDSPDEDALRAYETLIYSMLSLDPSKRSTANEAATMVRTLLPQGCRDLSFYHEGNTE